MVESLNIKNLSSGETKHFDMSDAAYLIYEGAIDWGKVDVSHNTFQFPTQIGQYISSTVIGSRDVSINGWIIGDSLEEIQNKKMELSNFLNPLDEVQILVDNYSIVGKPSSNVQFGKTLVENSDVAVKFLIQIFCPQALFLLKNYNTTDIAQIIGAFHFPLILKKSGIPMGYKKQSLFAEVVNDGAIDIGMKIVIEALGTVNNPEILNVNTHERIRMNKVLKSGEKVTISTIIGERDVIGELNGEESDYFKYFDIDSTWLQLRKGTNVLTYRTYDSSGDQDETYKNLNVYVEYKTALLNLVGE